MARTVRWLVMGSLVLAMLACSLAAQTNAPGTSPAASPTPAEQPEERVPISITEVLADEVDAGRWTGSEGIVNALRYLAGEPG